MNVFGQIRGRLVILAILVLTAAMALTACGGDDSTTTDTAAVETTEGTESSGGGEEIGNTAALENATYAMDVGPTGGGLRPAGDETQEEAEELGTKAGEENKKVKLPSGVTIGVIDIVKGAEGVDRPTDSLIFAAGLLGWDVVVCDGKGIPSQFVACGNSLLAEGVDAIAALAIEPGSIRTVIQKANSKGIPIVQFSGQSPLEGYNGSFYPDEVYAGEVMTEALVEKMSEVDNPEVAVQEAAGGWAEARLGSLNKAADEGKFEIVSRVLTDAANLVPFTRNATTTQITQNPDLSAIYYTWDSTAQVGGQVVSSKYPGKEFPEKPLVTTFHGDLVTLELMEAGAIDLVVDFNYDAPAWVTVDAIAQELARDEPMSKEPQPKFPGIGDGYDYFVLTNENLPPAGELAPTKVDVPSYFLAKWKAEYEL